LPEPEENGLTFEENAAIKAVAAAEGSGLPSLADDSGFCVEALGGDPGIYSARWAGPDKDFAMAMRTIEEKLSTLKADTPDKRRGSFVAVLCLAWPDGHKEYFRGEVHGDVVWPPRGTKGFGYDPMFKPDGKDITFGEMTSEEKHGLSAGAPPLSHRARASGRLRKGAWKDNRSDCSRDIRRRFWNLPALAFLCRQMSLLRLQFPCPAPARRPGTLRGRIRAGTKLFRRPDQDQDRSVDFSGWRDAVSHGTGNGRARAQGGVRPLVARRKR
jgi:XTP/dITP diphosphohydrolase